MKLRFADQAVVEETKLTGYLLNPSHPQGHSKAYFFGRLGFDRQHPDLLRQALLHLAGTVDMEESISAYGTKFVGVGTLQGPTGGKAHVTTIWILKSGAPPPILVTAYPG